MEKILLLAACLLLPAVMTAAQDKKAGDEGRTERAVRKVLADQAAAWNRCDLEDFMEGYWKSPELSFTSGNRNTRGWQATLDNYRRGYPTCEKMGRLSFSELEVTVLGRRAAMVRGRFLLERGADDRPTGLFTLIFRKLAGEGWKIVHDHTSV